MAGIVGTKIFRLSLQLALLIGFLGSSCSTRSQPVASTTPGAMGQGSNTAMPAGSTALLPTPLPTLRAYGDETPEATAYPAAQAIRGDVIAFIVTVPERLDTYELWVANVDGSGEKRLVDNIGKSQVSRHRLEWSPDGRWISYNANDALWLVSPDGSSVRKFLSLPDKSRGILYSWSWSPDGSRIAYAQTPAQDADPRLASVGIVDVPSGQVHQLPDFDFGYSVSLSWTPDGEFLWLNSGGSLVRVDTASGRVVQEVPRNPDGGCPTEYFDAIVWAPNAEWFATTEHGVGYAGTWFCLERVDGTYLGGLSGGSTSSPVWEHTRNVLYFVARKLDVGSDPNFDADHRLMRYDVSTRKLERLLSLGRIVDFMWCVSLSPAGRTLALHGSLGDGEDELVLLNLNTYSTIYYSLDLKVSSPFGSCWAAAWASDGRNLVFLVNAPPPPGPLPGLQSRYYAFYAVNVQTGKPTAVSGWHVISEWAISPVPINR